MKQRTLFLFTTLFLLLYGAAAQQKIISGIVKDSHSDERLPFISVYFKGTQVGRSTDSAGTFSLFLKDWPSDTLEFTSVGYQPYKLFIDKSKDSIYAVIMMERGKFNEEVVFKIQV